MSIVQAALDRSTSERFTVWQFFVDGTRESTENIPAKQAVETAYQWTHNVASTAGVTQKVTIVDADDYVVFEWLYGAGIIFPAPERNIKDYSK